MLQDLFLVYIVVYMYIHSAPESLVCRQCLLQRIRTVIKSEQTCCIQHQCYGLNDFSNFYEIVQIMEGWNVLSSVSLALQDSLVLIRAVQVRDYLSAVFALLI